MDSVEHKVTEEMNVGLKKPYTADEVAATLQQMHPTKALGPNGSKEDQNFYMESLKRYFDNTWQNKMQIEKTLIESIQAINHALSLQKVFNDVRNSSSLVVGRTCRWQPPPSGFFKFNVDGVIFADVRKAGVGRVLQDDKGRVVMVASKLEDEVEDVATIELLTLLRGLQLCIPLGLQKLSIESDCLLMVQELQVDQDSYSANGNLIKEAESLMQHFQEIDIKHVNRIGNEVAHRLARYAWNVVDIHMWWENVPTFVDHAIWHDQNSLYCSLD
ncbi:hypothetical protein F2P56_014597 [Juglans regia]|uniref:Uncharacterized protein LOC108979122 n=2 Tax=Juglans regia TaxID=51240 RepID=A0A2I4DDN2_JUGRE|nr:uncharacterized protein LOC108979122 [Juglans regia]KAF5464524.1 hypothetical protein F2P56_014597 [Juglans regia]